MSYHKITDIFVIAICLYIFAFRIWPTYITTVLLFAFVLPYVSDGPMWKLVIYPNAESCQKNWWTNMLFINTYVDSYDMVIKFIHSKSYLFGLANNPCVLTKCRFFFQVLIINLCYITRYLSKLGNQTIFSPNLFKPN